MTDAPAGMAWPVKTREFHNHHFDWTIWNDFAFRDDDIVIGTYAKSGTTWVQQIVAQLLFNGDDRLEVAEMSPWLDLRVPSREVKLPAVARDMLTAEDCERYEAAARAELGDACAAWLMSAPIARAAVA